MRNAKGPVPATRVGVWGKITDIHAPKKGPSFSNFPSFSSCYCFGPNMAEYLVDQKPSLVGSCGGCQHVLVATSLSVCLEGRISSRVERRVRRGQYFLELFTLSVAGRGHSSPPGHSL